MPAHRPPVLLLSRCLPLAVLLALAACGGGDRDPTGAIPAELAATWEADRSCAPCEFSVASRADTTRKYDLIHQPPYASVQVTIERSGTFRLRYTAGVGVDTTLTGTARVQGSTLIVTDRSENRDTIDYSVGGGLLRLAYRDELRVYDFDGDGRADPGRAQLVLRRR